MKGFRYILLILALFASASMRGQYNPTNPAEPGAYYTLTLQATPSNGGSFNLSTKTSYSEGTNVSLRAYANTHFTFAGWELDGEVVSTSSSFTYTMPAKNVRLIAHYKYNPSNPSEPTEPDLPVYSTLSLSCMPSNAGSFNISSGNKYEVGASVSLRAYNNANFTFKNWTENGEVISTSASFNYVMKAGNPRLVANYNYTPSSPDEPSEAKTYYKLRLKSNPSGGGYFNVDSGNGYEEGSSVYLRAYNNQWYIFQNWTDESGDTVSKSSNFYYNMPGEHKELTANYRYDYNPNLPGEPNAPSEKENHVYGMTETGVRGQTIAYPIYLENSDEVRELKVDVAFPQGFTVNTDDIRLTGRAAGHEVDVASLGENNYRFYIYGNDALEGVNGKIFDLLVTVPDTATMGSTYPVILTHGVMYGMDDTQSPITVRSGNIYVEKISEDGLYAKFSLDKLHGRVKFTNLSSDKTVSYKWDFGDGTMSTEKSPLHVYEKSGYYNVKLTARGDVDEDVAEMTVLINDESSWKIEGTFFLSNEETGVRYFTSAESLFRFICSREIVNNVRISVLSDGNFTYPLTDINVGALRELQSSLASGNYTLALNKWGNGRNPVLSLGGQSERIDKSVVNDVIALGKNMLCDGVELKMWGVSFNPSQIWLLQNQTIHSGYKSAEVDFSHISSDLSFTWELSVSPSNVSGYLTSGTGSIPSMTIVNESVGNCELVYNIKANNNGSEFCEFTNSIIVTPSLVGLFSSLSPANGTVSESTKVTLSWNSITNAVYDVYLWDAVNQRPSAPVISGTSELRFISQNFCQNGNTYKWQVVARNESQTMASDTMSFAVRSLPDLHVSALDCSEAMAGQKFSVQWMVKNDGPGSTGNVEWNDYIWLVTDVYAGTSPSGESTNNATLLATVKNVKALESGESYQNSIDLTLNKRTYGNHYLIVASDMYSVSNIQWSAIGGSVINPYNPSQDGSSYKHLFASTSASYNKVYEQDESTTLSDNFFYKKIDIAVSLLPDLQVPMVTSEVIPLGSIHSESAAESYEATIPTPLTAAGIAHNKIFYSGKKVRVTAKIANKGDAPTENISWRNVLYISHSPNHEDEGLLEVASESTPRSVMEPDGSISVEFTFYLPYTWFGETYFHVYTDINDVVYEHANTVNNWGVSDKVDILLCPGADFVPVNLKTPASITSATPFNISYKVKNQGPGIPYSSPWKIMLPWHDRIYISKSNKGIDENALLLSEESQLGYFNSPPLPRPPAGIEYLLSAEEYIHHGANYEKNVEIDPSKLTDGTYYIYVHVDVADDVYEYEGESNNVICSDAIKVEHVAPDLSVELMSVSEDTLSTGREIAFSWKLKNTGTGDIKDAKITDMFYATVNMDGSGGMQFASVENNVWIAAGSEKTMHANIKIPSNSKLDGLRYIYVKTNANEQLPEANQSNNVSGLLKSWFRYDAEPVVTNTTKGINLTLDKLTVNDEFKPNAQVTLSYVIHNSGDTDMSDLEPLQEVFLSSKGKFSETEAVKCEIIEQKGSVKNLKAGSSATISLTFTVPAAMMGGNKYLHLFADRTNIIGEKKTDDNYLCRSVYINGNLADLEVVDYTLPDTLMTSTNTSLSFITQNSGEWNAANSTTCVYLSSDNRYDTKDVLLVSSAVGSLGKGGAVQSKATLNILDKNVGKFYILLRTDANDAIKEMKENNNLTAIPVTVVQSPLPDLSAIQISADDELTTGQNIRIKTVVKNIGQHATRSDKWSDTYYLSPSTVLNTSTATKIGSKAHVGKLTVNGTYTNDVSFKIPSTLQGNFMLFVVTDAANAITEGDENNNATCIPVYINGSADTPSDIAISSINAPARIKAGEEVNISYELSNEGEFTAAGSLHDVIYLSKDNKWDLDDEMVGVVSGKATITPGNTITRSVYGRITNVPEGDYYVIVKTNSTRTIVEKTDDNNTAVMSTPSKLAYNTITLGTSTSVNTSGYYKLEVPSGFEGKTIGFNLIHPEEAAVGLYASYETVPSTAKYDFAASKLLENQQEVLIPNAKIGNYYILAQDNAAFVNATGNVFAETETDLPVSTKMNLEAKEIHFGATSLSIKEGGNGGWVSTDINGALFDSIMDFRLKLDEKIIPAEAVTFNGMTKSRVTFNLNDAETGSYDVVSELPDGALATLPDGFRVIPGASVGLGAKIDAPSVVRVGSYAPISISYANGGNTDIEIYDLILVLDNGYLGTSIQDLERHQSILHIDVDSESDSRGYKAIPPGTKKTINLFMYQTTEMSNLTIYVVK